MKKSLICGICALLCCMILVACGDGSTTMDGGKDTNGMTGEPTEATDENKKPTSGENGEGAQQAADNIMDRTKNAIDNTGDAARNITKGTGKAIEDAGKGISNSVDDMTTQSR